jgi:adenylylsulfate kinase
MNNTSAELDVQQKACNVVWHQGHITKSHRNCLNGHDSGVIWFTGLSASGKSTLATLIEQRLLEQNIRAYVLDGDNIRHGLNSNLGFSAEDRTENIRRIVEVSKILLDAGIIVLTAFITPFNEQRRMMKKMLGNSKLCEVYVKCDLEECINRDPKGLYKKAQMGLIKEYTGISSPFEEPENPSLVIDTKDLSIEESVQKIFAHLTETAFFSVQD